MDTHKDWVIRRGKDCREKRLIRTSADNSCLADESLSEAIPAPRF